MSKERVTVIDLIVLEEYGVSLNELGAIISIYHDDDKLDFNDAGVDYEKLQENKFIKIIKDSEKNHYLLRQKGQDLIATLVGRGIEVKKKTKKKKQINVDVLTRLQEFRSKWKGLKPGSMGSLSSCRDKLTRWMQENPDYTFEEVLKAADAYLESLQGDYRFLQRADYFIYKQENNREEASRLSAFIDEIDLDTSQSDWTTKLN